MFRSPALLLAATVLLLQFVQDASLCCNHEGCHETHAHAADVAGDAAASIVGLCPLQGERHHDAHPQCTCVCHVTVAAVSGCELPRDAKVAHLPQDRPHMVLPGGHHLTSKPPPRA